MLRIDPGLFSRLSAEYRARNPNSSALDERARQSMVDGGSHAIRLLQPFPPRIVRASGAWIEDADGHTILDYWQGHLGNILGHNPPVLTEALAQAFASGCGLTVGMTDRLQIEYAELLARRTGAERVRLTTSGTLATMYAIMLARSFTGRRVVIKAGGGWHGGQPWALRGVSFQPGAGLGNPYDHLESDGLPAAMADEVVVCAYNDPQRLGEVFRAWGERAACLIVEPFMGAGGSLPASPEFLAEARRLTEQAGALLIFDEVIAGFRFRAGNAGALYGIQPDLATFGKIIGGGMPVSAVAGRADVLGLAGRDAKLRVKFSGGTYSGHPAALLAGKTMLEYLVAHEAEIYPRLAELGAQARRVLEESFAAEGILARCSGHDPRVLPGSSLFHLHFPKDEGVPLDRPETINDPALCSTAMSGPTGELAFLLEGVHLLHAHGAVSLAHTERENEVLGQAARRVARRLNGGKN